MEALEDELCNGHNGEASYIPEYNPYDLSQPVTRLSSKATKYQDLNALHKAQTHNEWDLLQKRLADRLKQPAAANNAKLQQEFTLQYRRKEEECLRYHLAQQESERDNARALASTIRNLHQNAPEEAALVVQNICRDLAFDFLSAYEASADPDFPWKATCEGTMQQFITILRVDPHLSADDRAEDAQAYLLGYFECISRMTEQPSTVMGQQFRTIAGAVLGRHPFGTIIQRFVECAKYLCTETRTNRLPIAVLINVVRSFVAMMRDAWYAVWKDANPACEGKLHDYFSIAIQHALFLRCPEIESLFTELNAETVNHSCLLQQLYEHCAVPEEWRVFPPDGVAEPDQTGSDIVAALPHIPFNRPAQELRVLAKAKTPLEIVAVLHRTVDMIIEECSSLEGDVRHLAADDVIPLLSLCFNLIIRHPSMGLDPGLLRSKFRFCDTFLPEHLANGAPGYILTIAQTGIHIVV